MTPSEIIQYARNLSWCRTDELSDAVLFWYMNSEYRKLWQEIALTDKNYKLQVLKTNLVQNVTEYALKDVDNWPTPETGQIKIEKLLIKYEEWQPYFFEARQVDRDSLPYAPDYMDEYQQRAEPLYILNDNSIRIFPKPDTSVTNGIELYSNQRVYDLTDTMTEDDVFIEREYHDVISRLIIPYIYQHRQQDDRVWYYQQQAFMKRKQMMDNITRRATTPFKWKTMKDLYKYVY